MLVPTLHSLFSSVSASVQSPMALYYFTLTNKAEVVIAMVHLMSVMKEISLKPHVFYYGWTCLQMETGLIKFGSPCGKYFSLA